MIKIKETPHLYRKLHEMVRQYEQEYEELKIDMRRDIASRFRLTNNDVKIVLDEIGKNNKKRTNP